MSSKKNVNLQFSIKNSMSQYQLFIKFVNNIIINHLSKKHVTIVEVLL